MSPEFIELSYLDQNEQLLYIFIYDNIDIILEKYNNILKLDSNPMTYNYLNDEYSIKEAYSMTLMTILYLYFQITN